MKTAISMVFILKLYWYLNKLKKALGLIHQREPWTIGITKLNMDDAYKMLISIGYAWDYFAWEDIGEGVSARLLYENRQVHVRVFTDSEVRVHDELNYEFDPWGHYNSVTLRKPSTETITKIKDILKIK